MSFVESHLMPGERITYRAHLHWMAYGNGAALAVILLVVALAAQNGVLVLLAGLCFLPPYIRIKTSEFAVTDQRVLIKVGWLNRRSLETLLDKIEGIAIEQGMFARLYGYGTIVVSGTGGTHERFTMIAQPLEFRKQVQMGAAQKTATPAEGVLIGRSERDCPFCGERVLTKARVCKHCGRDIAVVTT